MNRTFFEEADKLAMIPTNTPDQNKAQKRLEKTQKVGTPDDPNGPKYKGFNMFKPPKMPTTTVATSTSSKMASATPGSNLFAKLAFGQSSFSGDMGYGRFPMVSGMPAFQNPAMGSRDPMLKESGNKPKKLKEIKKQAFTQSGSSGDIRNHGAWSGTGSRGGVSGLAPWQDPPMGAVDPQLKMSGGTGDRLHKFKQALMVKESD